MMAELEAGNQEVFTFSLVVVHSVQVSGDEAEGDVVGMAGPDVEED